MVIHLPARRSRWLLRAAAISLVALGAVSSHAACPDPNADQVVIYQHPEFNPRGGRCSVLEIGSYPNSCTFAPVVNDSVSSIKVGTNVRAIVFEHSPFAGKDAVYERGEYPVMEGGVFETGADGEASSIIVEKFAVRPTSTYYIGNSPAGAIVASWTSDVQGLANDGSHWYITTNSKDGGNDKIRKYHFRQDIRNAEPLAVKGISIELLNRGCDHFGDTDHLAGPFSVAGQTITGIIFVPVEGNAGTACGNEPALALFDRETLEFLNWDFFYLQPGDRLARGAAGWLAIDQPREFLYSSEKDLDGVSFDRRIIRYVLDFGNLNGDRSDEWFLFDAVFSLVTLFRRDGSLPKIYTVQGARCLLKGTHSIYQTAREVLEIATMTMETDLGLHCREHAGDPHCRKPL